MSLAFSTVGLPDSSLPDRVLTSSHLSPLLLLQLLSSFHRFSLLSTILCLLTFNPPLMMSHDHQSLGHEVFEGLLIGSIIRVVIFNRDCRSRELGCGFCLINPYHDCRRKGMTCQLASTILRVSRLLKPGGWAQS